MSAIRNHEESDEFHEWLLSDHPDARAERRRRREAHYQSEIKQADEIQASARGRDTGPGQPEPFRRLAESMQAMADNTRARAEAEFSEPDTEHIVRERDEWVASLQLPGQKGWWRYRYPARYIGAPAAVQPQPPSGPAPGPSVLPTRNRHLDGSTPSSFDWRRYQVGSAEHYAGYEEEFVPSEEMPDDPQDSYEIDYAYELAYDAYVDSGGWGAAAELEERQFEEEIMPLLHQAEQVTFGYGFGRDPYNPEPDPEADMEPF